MSSQDPLLPLLSSWLGLACQVALGLSYSMSRLGLWISSMQPVTLTGFILTSNSANLEPLRKRLTSMRMGAVALSRPAISSHSLAACSYAGSREYSSAVMVREFKVTATVPLYGATPSLWLKRVTIGNAQYFPGFDTEGGMMVTVASSPARYSST